MIRVGARRVLSFDEPFGEGDDRHTHVRAASAIVPYAGGWLIAQDDSNFAAHVVGDRVMPVRLFPRAGADTFSERAGTKAQKPDIESGTVMTIAGASVAVFFGSGSTPARMRVVVVRGDLSTLVVDFAQFFDSARVALGVSADELNIEGACAVGDVVRFFQRGNAGAGAINASFDVEAQTIANALTAGWRVEPGDVENVRRYDLGDLGGAPLGFSAAAALRDGRVVFAASAEASPNTYDDGVCTGSVIGILDASQQISARFVVDAGDGPVKIEGLAVGQDLSIVAVTDSDDPGRPAELLEMSIPVE